MDARQVSIILEEIALLLELKGENPFKTRAYHQGAEVVAGLPGDLKELVESGRLLDLKGIGPALAEKISTLVKTGRLEFYEKLKEEIPAGLLKIVKLPGLGPKKVKVLHDQLGIKTVGELEYACNENRLLTLKGFGEKSQEKILKAIAFHRQHADEFLFSKAWPEALELQNALQKMPAVKAAEIAGSLRRRKEVVHDADLVVATDKPLAVMEFFIKLPGLQKVISQGDTKSSVVLACGLQADLRCVTVEQYPFALLHFTGSKEHNVGLRQRAIERGLKLNEYGLFKNDTELIPCTSEDDIYKKLGLNFIPPELRENRGEIDAAAVQPIPVLVTEKDLHGIFHVHTLYSDGTASVEDMAREAARQGFKYIGISDHSEQAFYAGGLKEEAIARQHAEIEALNKKLPIKIFKGIEADILADGSLDYSPAILQKFDFVIASVHSRFQMNRDEMTARIIRALENPYTTMLGHMTGRLLLSREPYELDVEAVFKTAARHRKIIELNANPQRLDVDWRYLDLARKYQVKICINPDAHKIEGIAHTAYGVGIARKGGLTPEMVVNTKTVLQMQELLSEMKTRRAS